jgi:hypothetical protein
MKRKANYNDKDARDITISHTIYSIESQNYHCSWKYINMTGATSGAETAYPPRAPEFAPGF